MLANEDPISKALRMVYLFQNMSFDLISSQRSHVSDPELPTTWSKSNAIDPPCMLLSSPVHKLRVLSSSFLPALMSSSLYLMSVIALKPGPSFCGLHQPPVYTSPDGISYLTSSRMSKPWFGVLFCKDATHLEYACMLVSIVAKSLSLAYIYAYVDKAPSRAQC